MKPLRNLALTAVLALSIALPARASAETDPPGFFGWLGAAAGMGATSAAGAALGAAAGTGAVYGTCTTLDVCQAGEDGSTPSLYFIAVGAVVGGAIGTGIGLFTAGTVTAFAMGE